MLQDLRFAARMLTRAPGFALTAVLTLVLGIGATTLMFSIADAVLWRPLPFPEPDRLVAISSVTAAPDRARVPASALDFADWRAEARSVDALAAHVGSGFSLREGGEPELVMGQYVTADFFRALGVGPMAGRTFTADEFSPGGHARLILSHGLWTRRFGRDPSVAGRTTLVDGRPFTIVGVMPPGFAYPDASYELWAPLPSPRTPELPPENRAAHYLRVIGRLQPGATIDAAGLELQTIAARLGTQFPDTNQDLSVDAAPLREYATRDARAPLFLLLGAVALVVLIACGNVTNLLLARATARAREVAIRQALGAGRWRLVRQFLTESLLLYALGAAGAVAAAAWGLAGFVALDLQALPRLDQAAIDGRVLLATMAVSLVSAVLFGIGPALQAAGPGATVALRERLASGATAARQRWRMTLVVAEIALAVVLLVGAGLTLRSLASLVNVDPGFTPGRQLTFGVVLPPGRYASIEQVRAAAVRLSEGIVARPGVRASGATTHLPLSGQNIENGFQLEGFEPSTPAGTPVAGMRGVVGAYFTALGVEVKAGRLFTDADRDGSEPVAIVNEAFARRYWPGEDPLGKRLLEFGHDGPMRRVVGVIGDIRHAGPAVEARPEVSIPYGQLDPGYVIRWARGLWFVVDTALPAAAALDQVRAAVADADPLLPLVRPQPMSALASDAVAEPRFRTALMAGFAGLALSLAAVGIFGVLAFTVAQRTREIGIRVALGARPQEVLHLILRQSLGMAAAGIALGLAIAVPLAIWLRSLLFGIEPVDLVTLATAVVLLAAVAAVASGVPARRALRIAPIVALKSE